ncbi:MFS transporter [Massilia sp. H-1]|nr:MFS transporter [Massilia sp. H-1]
MHTKLLIAAACLLGLFATIGASLPYPILPPLFASGASNGLNTFLGLPPKFLFGLALTINPLGLLIGNALLGPLSDRYGRRPLLLLTALGAAIGHAVTACALLIESYPLFIFARFATGLMEGNGAVARAMLADKLEGDLRVKALSWLNGAFYMGWLAGPLLAGATLVFGLTVPFWIACAALVLTALMVALALLRPKRRRRATSSWWQVARGQHAFNLLRHTELRMLFIVQLAYTCGVTAFYEFYPLWLVEVAKLWRHRHCLADHRPVRPDDADLARGRAPQRDRAAAPRRMECQRRGRLRGLACARQCVDRPRRDHAVRHSECLLQRGGAGLVRRALRQLRPRRRDGIAVDDFLPGQYSDGTDRLGADPARHAPDPAAGRHAGGLG